MTNKTTEALKLAEEALYAELESDTCEEFAEAAEKCHKALAAIREALAETVNQEPVAWAKFTKDCIAVSDKPFEDAKPLYAAPVSAPKQKPVKQELNWGANKFMPHEQPVKQEPVALLDVFSGWSDIADVEIIYHAAKKLPDGEYKLYAAPVQPVKQDPVAVISEFAIGLVKLHSNGACLPFGTPLYAAPVDAKAIRAEALEEAAKWCEAKQSYNAMHANTEFAAGIRGLK